MALSRKERDAILTTMCRYSQDYLDHVHKGAEEYRDVLGPRLLIAPEEREELESDSDFDGAHIALLSPPQTPKGGGLGQQMSKHIHRVLPASTSSQKSSVRWRNPRPASTVSER